MSTSYSEPKAEPPGIARGTGHRLLFEQSELGMYTATGSGQLLDVNPALARMGGHGTPEAFLASIERLESMEAGGGEWAGTVQMPHSTPSGSRQYRLRRKDGSSVLCWLDESISDSDDSGGSSRTGVLREMTSGFGLEGICGIGDRRMELIGRISHCASQFTDLEQILETILTGTMDVVGADSGVIFLTDGGGRLKLRAHRNVERAFLDRYLNNDLAPGEGVEGTVLRTGESVFISRDAVGDPRSLAFGPDQHSFIGVPLIACGKTLGVIGVGTNFRRSMDESDVPLVEMLGEQLGLLVRNAQLFEDHARLATAIDQSSDIVTITGTDGLMTYVNPTFEFVTGYSRNEAVGQSPSILRSGRHDDRHYKDLWRTIKGGGVWIGRFVNRKKDGTLWEAESTIAPVRDATNTIIAFVEVKRDITETMEMRERLRGAERMESIGRLAGGIAHDFNNVLAIINGYSDVLLSELPPDDPTTSIIQAIRKAGNRGGALTRQLLAFSKGQKVKLNELDLNQVVRESKSMLAETLGPGIDFRVRLDPGLRPVLADRVQFEQILVNLVVNARDAMPKGGLLTIETATVASDSGGNRAGVDHTILRVVDTGIGVSQDLAQRIFDPFFTTKTDAGTGLGLAIVKEIVDQSRGQVSVDSRAGGGATFIVSLPCLKAAPEPDGHRGSGDAPSPGAETVLIVDDEEDVLNFARLVLERSGYRVLTALGAVEAERILAAEGGAVSVMVTDVNMPGTNGIGLARRVTTLYPEMALVFLSGQAEQLDSHHEFDSHHVLAKPVDPQDLTHVLRSAIDEGVQS